jgi:hypothetical protein
VAQDVAGDGLEALRSAPVGVGGARWLAPSCGARANVRGEARRISRERIAARRRTSPRIAPRARVAMQHKVVEAARADGPVPTVVLHYCQGPVVRDRRGTPRRARGDRPRATQPRNDLLRERLDTEYGGDRSVWCAGLAALARGRGATLAPKVAVLGALGAAAPPGP